MPFKSEAQRRYFHAKLPHLVEEWEAHTPKKKLPSRVTKKRKVVKKKKSGKKTKRTPRKKR